MSGLVGFAPSTDHPRVSPPNPSASKICTLTLSCPESTPFLDGVSISRVGAATLPPQARVVTVVVSPLVPLTPSPSLKVNWSSY